MAKEKPPVAAVVELVSLRIAEDPAFYEIFSKLIQQAIEDFRVRRLSDLDYLNKVMEIRNKVTNRQHDDIPGKLSGNEDAIAYFGVIKPFFEQHHLDETECEELSADTDLAIQDILNRYWKVQFWDDEDAQKQVINNNLQNRFIDSTLKYYRKKLSLQQFN